VPIVIVGATDARRISSVLVDNVAGGALPCATCTNWATADRRDSRAEELFDSEPRWAVTRQAAEESACAWTAPGLPTTSL